MSKTTGTAAAPVDNSARNRRLKLGAIAVSIAAVFGTVGFVALSGGTAAANFSSSAPVNVHADAGTLKLVATGELNFTNLVPGTPQSDTVTFKNNGTVKMNELKVGAPVTVDSFDVPAGQNPDFNQVYVSILGYLPETKVTSIGSAVNIGTLNAGQERTYTVVLTVKKGVDDAADNKFQGVAATGKVTATGRS